MAPTSPSPPPPADHDSTRRSKKRKFATLESQIQNISQAAIRKKWKKLPDGAQDRVRVLLESVARPATMLKTGNNNTNTEAKALEAQATVMEVVTILTSKIPRMPFPPGTEEASFDFEATLNRTRFLETQLTANLHSISLLKGEIEKQEQLLEQDQVELEDLQQGFKDTIALGRRQARNLHPLIQSLDSDLDRQNATQDVEELAVSKSKRAPPVRSLENDPDLEPLLSQLRDHLESMHNNTATTREIVEAMHDSQTALDLFTATSLGKSQYDQLYGLEIT